MGTRFIEGPLKISGSSCDPPEKSGIIFISCRCCSRFCFYFFGGAEKKYICAAFASKSPISIHPRKYLEASIICPKLFPIQHDKLAQQRKSIAIPAMNLIISPGKVKKKIFFNHHPDNKSFSMLFPVASHHMTAPTNSSHLAVPDLGATYGSWCHSRAWNSTKAPESRDPRQFIHYSRKCFFWV